MFKQRALFTHFLPFFVLSNIYHDHQQQKYKLKGIKLAGAITVLQTRAFVTFVDVLSPPDASLKLHQFIIFNKKLYRK